MKIHSIIYFFKLIVFVLSFLLFHIASYGLTLVNCRISDEQSCKLVAVEHFSKEPQLILDPQLKKDIDEADIVFLETNLGTFDPLSLLAKEQTYMLPSENERNALKDTCSCLNIQYDYIIRNEFLIQNQILINKFLQKSGCFAGLDFLIHQTCKDLRKKVIYLNDRSVIEWLTERAPISVQEHLLNNTVASIQKHMKCRNLSFSKQNIQDSPKLTNFTEKIICEMNKLRLNQLYEMNLKGKKIILVIGKDHINETNIATNEVRLEDILVLHQR